MYDDLITHEMIYKSLKWKIRSSHHNLMNMYVFLFTDKRVFPIVRFLEYFLHAKYLNFTFHDKQNTKKMTNIPLLIIADHFVSMQI